MIRFGTGGWRAVIGDGFTKKNIQLLSAAMCVKMKQEGLADKGIVLGYDRRFLSKETMRWCGQVFAAAGIRASLVNKSSPTPLIMFYVMRHELPYGMMITASHNPAIYNGIKVFTEGGRDADKTVTDEIERIAEGLDPDAIPEMEYEEALRQGLIREIYPINEYLDDILDKINVKAIREANLRVAFDPMFGVSEVPLQILLLTTRCDVEMMHNTHDTLFGGRMPAPSAVTMRQLSTKVMDYRFHIGVATDGDADRLGVIDENEARSHAGKSILTQHLGIRPEELLIEPYISDRVILKDGDCFLLCSDGLTESLTGLREEAGVCSQWLNSVEAPLLQMMRAGQGVMNNERKHNLGSLKGGLRRHGI